MLFRSIEYAVIRSVNDLHTCSTHVRPPKTKKPVGNRHTISVEFPTREQNAVERVRHRPASWKFVGRRNLIVVRSKLCIPKRQQPVSWVHTELRISQPNCFGCQHHAGMLADLEVARYGPYFASNMVILPRFLEFVTSMLNIPVLLPSVQMSACLLLD